MSEQQSSEEQEMREFLDYLTQRIVQGEQPEAICAELIAKGMDSQLANKIIGGAAHRAEGQGPIERKDFRAKLTAAEFDLIPVDEDDPSYPYYEKLIAENSKFRGINEEFPGGFGDIRLIKRLTKGQQILILLGAFDGEVKNGGITQFFWNCPEYIFEVRDVIEYLADSEVLRNYDQALEALVGKQNRWLELRGKWCKSGESPRWETFQQTYELLDLGWFDRAYFDKCGYNEKGEWVRQQRGMHYFLMNRLAEYVKSHKGEFIEDESPN